MTGLHVGFIAGGYAPQVGGIESHLRAVTAELIARGVRVSVLALDSGGQHPPYSTRTEERDEVHVTRLSYAYHDHDALADVIRNPEAERTVKEWIGERQPDVVHVQHLTGFGAGALHVLEAAGVPSVMTLHDYWMLCPRGQMWHVEGRRCESAEVATCAQCLAATWPHLMPSTGGASRAPDGEAIAGDERVAAARTDYALRALQLPRRLLVPSHAAADVFVRSGLDPERLEVCENGFDHEALALATKALRGNSRLSWQFRLRLGVLGSVLPSKGVFELATALLDVDVPSLTLEVHGPLVDYHGDDSYITCLRELASIDDRIRLHGPYDWSSLPEILAGLDAVAAPALWEEVYGLGVREARAVGLPVLVSDRGGLPELVHDGGGVVVPAGDHGAWVRTLRDFATDKDARERWRAAPVALRGVSSMVDQLQATYTDVVSRQPSAKG